MFLILVVPKSPASIAFQTATDVVWLSQPDLHLRVVLLGLDALDLDRLDGNPVVRIRGLVRVERLSIFKVATRCLIDLIVSSLFLHLHKANSGASSNPSPVWTYVAFLGSLPNPDTLQMWLLAMSLVFSASMIAVDVRANGRGSTCSRKR